MFGSDLLVAPLLESGSRGRNVYLPPGSWIDYQTGRTYAGGWHAIDAGEIPVVLLVRDGALIPHIGLAQSTAFLDWSKLEAVVFATSSTTTAHGKVALPTGGWPYWGLRRTSARRCSSHRRAIERRAREDPFMRHAPEAPDTQIVWNVAAPVQWR